jgi:hypothetical protein
MMPKKYPLVQKEAVRLEFSRAVGNITLGHRLVIAVDDEDSLELSEFELGPTMVVDAPFLGAISPIVARDSVSIGAAEPCVT